MSPHVGGKEPCLRPALLWVLCTEGALQVSSLCENPISSSSLVSIHTVGHGQLLPLLMSAATKSSARLCPTLFLLSLCFLTHCSAFSDLLALLALTPGSRLNLSSSGEKRGKDKANGPTLRNVVHIV